MARFNSTFENALVAWVKAALGNTFTVFWDKQSAPTPALPYATLNIITAGNIETTNRKFNNDLSTDLIFYENMVVSVNIHASSNHLGLMMKLRRSIFDSVIRSNLNKAGITPRKNLSAIQDLTEINETQYEFRAQADFEFAYLESLDESDTGFIERISGTIINEPFDVNTGD